METHFRFRPPNPAADVPALTRLYNEIEAVDQIEGPITEEEMETRVTWPGYDPAQDAWVVEAPGDPAHLIAHTVCWRPGTTPRGSFFVLVHPAWRRQGLGRALLTGAVTRLQAKGASYATTEADTRHPAVRPFLLGHGFQPRATRVAMTTPADVALPALTWPADYTGRTYAEVQDPDLLLRALNEGFVGNFDHRDMIPSELAHWLASPQTRQDGIFLAFDAAGAVAGVCWAEIQPGRSARRGRPTGYIDSLAVLPAHRRRGVGRALLLAGMAWLRAHGQATIELDAWIDNTQAQPLYQGVGFAVTHESTWYRRDLSAAEV